MHEDQQGHLQMDTLGLDMAFEHRPAVVCVADNEKQKECISAHIRR